jgi:DNA-binding XRE family transcriptional regulator
MSAKPKFDPADCRDCKWNHANFSDEGFAKSGHCQMLEDAPPVKCALRCPALAMSKPQTARPSAGDWVQVKLSQYAKRRSIGRVTETTDSTVTVEVYRRRIERMEQHTLPSALIVGAAQEDDRLSCARELVELRSVRERRERLGCTQRQLAEVSGVDVGTLRSAELGDRRTHKHVRRWILEALRRVETRKAAS